MINFRYFLMRFKLLVKPFFLTLTLITCVCAVCLAVISNLNSAGTNKIKIKVGIVGDTDNELLGFAINFLENADEVKEYISLRIFEDEEDACNAVENGEIAGCVVFSEEFLSSVTGGDNLPLKYITRKTTVDISSAVVNELLETVSAMVVDVQTAAFLADDYLDSIPEFSDSNIWYKIDLFLIDKVLARESTVEVVSSLESGISLGGYYFASVSVLIVLVIGIVYGVYLVRSRIELYRLLDSSGCHAYSQVLSEILSYVISVVVIFAILFMAFFAFFDSASSIVTEFYGIDGLAIFEMFICLLPGIILLCIMQFFLYSICKNTVSGLLMQVVVSIGLCYVSGCFYPSSFLPKAMIEFVNILPVGNAFKCFQEALCGICSAESFVLCFVWIVVLLFATVAVRRFSIKAGE